MSQNQSARSAVFASEGEKPGAKKTNDLTFHGFVQGVRFMAGMRFR